ncbi:hypothetical protein [Trinickia terrae]|nr:hypothetical protein [Trinickia terrae]
MPSASSVTAGDRFATMAFFVPVSTAYVVRPNWSTRRSQLVRLAS